MKAKIVNVIGPYDGPFERIITYKLKLENKNIIVWHENGKRNFPNFKKNDLIKGLVLNKKRMIPDYKNSDIKMLNQQLSLL
jgi:predicted ATP-dependent protease